MHLSTNTCVVVDYTPVTPAKPTSNRQKNSNSGRDRFIVGIDSVLSVWCRFMFGQTNLSGRDLSNMFARSLPDKLSVVCRLYVGVVSVLSITVCGVISTYKSTPKIPQSISSPKWRHKIALLEVCHN